MKHRWAARCAAGIAFGLVAAMAPPASANTNPPGSGYWMVAQDGLVSAFGTAQLCPDEFGDLHESFDPDEAQTVDIAATPDGRGYWTLVIGDDGAYIGFHHCDFPSGGNGYETSNVLDLPAGEEATSIAAKPDGTGYWVFTNRGR